MRATILKAITLWVMFLALAAPPVHAQESPSTRPEARSPLSQIAHDVSTWLSRVTGSSPGQHRFVSAPPLPRPRPIQAPASMASKTGPAEAAPAPKLSNKEPEALARAPKEPKNKASPPVLIND